MLRTSAALATRLAYRALGFRTGVVTFGDWRIRVHRGAPRGEPWILLHGLGATSGTWLPLVRRLRGECRFVLPELSRLGGSRGPRPALSVPEGAALIDRLLASDFAGRSPTVCGISLGGWMAVRAAAEAPTRFARLLLVVPGGYRDQDWERISRMVRVASYQDSEAMWRALFVSPPWWLRRARPIFYLSYRSPEVAAILATVREEDAFGDEELARLDLPVGLIWGERDDLFRLEVGERMAAVLPHGRLWSVAGAAHALQWERPADFVEAVRSFRAAMPLPSPATEAQDRADGLDAGR